ncbi:MAG: aminopeptidase P family protein [Deltaproteobacteria bacterium]|nr:aminopeptidase P family protein [Deltaproteobacteria bacterium]
MYLPDCDADDLVKRIATLLDAHGLTAWLVLTREASRDPVAAHLGAGHAVARTACVFGRVDGQMRRVAVAASYDVAPLQACGLYDTVVGYKQEGLRPHLAAWLRRLDVGAVGINESRDVPLADGLSAGMRSYLHQLCDPELAGRLATAERLVIDLLSHRSAADLRTIEAAVLRTQAVARQVLAGGAIVVGRSTEREVAEALRAAVVAGGDHLEFVSVNVGASRGHGGPTDRPLNVGDLLRVDFGIKHRGFCSDLQRTIYLTAPGFARPPAEIARMWAVNRAAFAAALQAIRPGATGCEVDAAARAVVTAAGYPSYPHATGHALGREVHDIGPILGPDWPERYGMTVHLPLRAGQVLAVEPAVYGPDPRSAELLHIAVEHDVVVTEDGCRLLGEDQPEIWVVGADPAPARP